MLSRVLQSGVRQSYGKRVTWQRPPSKRELKGVYQAAMQYMTAVYSFAMSALSEAYRPACGVQQCSLPARKFHCLVRGCITPPHILLPAHIPDELLGLQGTRSAPSSLYGLLNGQEIWQGRQLRSDVLSRPRPTKTAQHVNPGISGGSCRPLYSSPIP